MLHFSFRSLLKFHRFPRHLFQKVEVRKPLLSHFEFKTLKTFLLKLHSNFHCFCSLELSILKQKWNFDMKKVAFYKVFRKTKIRLKQPNHEAESKAFLKLKHQNFLENVVVELSFLQKPGVTSPIRIIHLSLLNVCKYNYF